MKIKAKISFKKCELEAIIGAAENMRDGLEYFSFLPRDEYKKFIAGYETGIEKIRKALKLFK